MGGDDCVLQGEELGADYGDAGVGGCGARGEKREDGGGVARCVDAGESGCVGDVAAGMGM